MLQPQDKQTNAIHDTLWLIDTIHRIEQLKRLHLVVRTVPSSSLFQFSYVIAEQQQDDRSYFVCIFAIE